MSTPASRKNPQPIRIGETPQEAAEMLQQLVDRGVLEVIRTGEVHVTAEQVQRAVDDPAWGDPRLYARFRSANHPGGIVYGVNEGVEGLSLVPDGCTSSGGENVPENEEKRGDEGECPRTGTGLSGSSLRYGPEDGTSPTIPFASPAGAEPAQQPGTLFP